MVDKYLSPLRAKYSSHYKDIACGIWSEDGEVQLHFSYTPILDGKPRVEKMSMPARNASSDREREAFIATAIASFSAMLDRRQE